MKHEILRIENVIVDDSKNNRVLNQFFLNLYQNEVIGVFIDNVKEKNYLINLLLGIIPCTTGRICFDDQPVLFNNHNDDFLRKNIVLIQEKSVLIDKLTISENIFVMKYSYKGFFINYKDINFRASEILNILNIPLNPSTIVGNLNNLQKKSIEIAKAYTSGAKIIILKDLSAYLSDVEIKEIFDYVKKIKNMGISIILIDSYSDIFQFFCDRVIVMQNGVNTWTFDIDDYDDRQLKSYFYREISESQKQMSKSDKVAIEFKNITSNELNNTSFLVKEGEIVSLIDKDGNALNNIRELLSGKLKPEKGEIIVDDKPYLADDYWQALNKGVAFINEYASEKMVFDNLNFSDNLCFITSKRINWFWMYHHYKRIFSKDYKRFFDGKNMLDNAKKFSEKDFQKLVYYRWHLYKPKVVVCVKPFSTSDTSMRELTIKLINSLAEKRIGVIILTSNEFEVNILGRKIILNM